MEDETPVIAYEDELLRLAAEKKIKHSAKYIENASEETLKKIYDEHQKQELEEVNEQVTCLIINKLSELLGNLDMVKSNEALEKDLATNKAFKKDVKEKIIGRLTPYIPLVGLFSGGITISAHMADKQFNPDKDKQPNLDEGKQPNPDDNSKEK